MTPAERVAYDQGVREMLDLFQAVNAVTPGQPTALTADAQDVTMRRFADAVARLDPRSLRVLRPWDTREAITPKEAATIAGCQPSTVYKWVERFAIGRSRVGAVQVSRPALAMLLDDDLPALARYLTGDRTGPLVTPYFERAGLLKIPA